VYFTDLVIYTGIVEDALGSGGFTGVDVGRNPYIPGIF
jgi:hypothetical protein